MSKIEYTDDNKVIKRSGEYFEIGSVYCTPRSIGSTQNDDWQYKADKLVFFQLFSDVDELTNKPRRFFDHMLSLVEYMRDSDLQIDEGNHRKHWDEIIKGCELWLSAVEHGVYGEVLKYAQPTSEAGRQLLKDNDIAAGELNNGEA